MGVGKRIRALRKASGLSQGKLAALASIPQSTLSSIEHGDSKIPRGDHLSQIASALKVNQEWLITGLGSPVPLVQPDIDESELIQIYRDMTDTNKGALIATARALLTSQPMPTPASPLKRPHPNPKHKH